MATIVEGDQKVSFSIATTPRCRRGRYSFPWIAPLYPWYVPYIAECLARRYQVPFLKSLVWPLPNTQSTRPMSWLVTINQYKQLILISIDARRSWRNGYHQKKWVQLSEFKSWTKQFAFYIALEKAWIQPSPPQAMGKIVWKILVCWFESKYKRSMYVIPYSDGIK